MTTECHYSDCRIFCYAECRSAERCYAKCFDTRLVAYISAIFC